MTAISTDTPTERAEPPAFDQDLADRRDLYRQCIGIYRGAGMKVVAYGVPRVGDDFLDVFAKVGALTLDYIVEDDEKLLGDHRLGHVYDFSAAESDLERILFVVTDAGLRNEATSRIKAARHNRGDIFLTYDPFAVWS